MAVYSHSKFSTFEQCKLKYKFRYIDKIPVVVEATIESFLGNLVHSSLEWLYNKVREKTIPQIQELLEYYQELWVKGFSEKIKIVKEDQTQEDYFIKGIHFLKNYYNKNKPFDDNTIALEKKILINLDEDGENRLTGYIDRLVFNEKEKSFEIHDYKTSSRLKTQQELDEDRQLALYSLALKDLTPGVTKFCLTWHFLAFDKKLCSSRTHEQLEKLRKETLELIKQIELNKEWPANTSPLCNWCEYMPICPKWKHIFEKRKIQKQNKERGSLGYWRG